MAYRYEQLPPFDGDGQTRPYTRILHLEPGSGDEEPFCGHLEIINVEHAPPPYEALSYTWGNHDPSDYFWLHGCPLPIRPNLLGALRALRLPTQVRRLWIDALCIDQENLDERSRQVQYMRLVYKHAARVIAWLGPKARETEAAFEAARRISEVGKMIEQQQLSSSRTLTGDGARCEPLDNSAVFGLIGSMLTDLPERSLANLRAFFDREYYCRCWVLQELVASSEAIAKCEDLEMPFFDLASTIIFLGAIDRKVEIAVSLDVWYMVSAIRQGNGVGNGVTHVAGSLGPMIDILENMRDFKSADIRDKIFATIGICDEGLAPGRYLPHLSRQSDQYRTTVQRVTTGLWNHFTGSSHETSDALPHALKPNYKKDAASVYTDLASYLMYKPPYLLDVLSFVQHHSQPSADDYYPSWVPKWFESKLYHVFRGEMFRAGICTGLVSDLLRTLARPRILSPEGFHVGVVQKVSEVMLFNFADGHPDDDRLKSEIQDIWSQLFPMPLVHHPRVLYRTGEPLDVAFCMALSAFPMGILYASCVGESAAGLSMPKTRITKDDATEKMQQDTAHFLATLAQTADTSSQSSLPPGVNVSDRERFRNSVCWYSRHRRAFLTREGHVGIGPPVMQPGDEVAVLFRGKMPYVVRRRRDHHVFLGDCYVRDDDIMFGKVTENVRNGRGGPPVFTYELR